MDGFFGRPASLLVEAVRIMAKGTKNPMNFHGKNKKPTKKLKEEGWQLKKASQELKKRDGQKKTDKKGAEGSMEENKKPNKDAR